ncbi:MAG: hypothetical protein HC913_10785 [Microscillaceae bacterium]|nr:hypothetical protein [Microscillaceae bacterium]
MNQASLLQLFVQEAQEQQAIFEQYLAQLESNPDDLAGLDALFRIMHTLKANAMALEQKPIGELAHFLEDLLNLVRKKNSASRLTGLPIYFRPTTSSIK